jgi:hypothetical protein
MSSIVESYLFELQYKEYVEERFDQLLLEGWSITELRNAAEKNVQVMKNWLINNGIDIDKIISKISSNVNRVKSIIMKAYNNGDSPQSVVQKLQSFMKKLIETVVKLVKEYFDTMQGDSLLARILQVNTGLYAFIVIAIINTFLKRVGESIGGPVGWVFSSLIEGPMIEEMAKHLSITAGAPFIITGIWTGLEFGMYVRSAIGAGMSITKAIILRMTTLMMHMATLFLQKFFKEKWKDSKYAQWIDLTGFFLAVAIHTLWNKSSFITDTFNKFGFNIPT